MKKLVAIASIAAGSLIATPPAISQVKAETYKVEFTFDRSAPSADTYRELERIARRVCRTEASGELEFARSKIERRCRSELVEKAVVEIGSSDLSSYYTAQTGRFAGGVSLAGRSE